MVHQFQSGVSGGGGAGGGCSPLIRITPPLWFMEGMAEYLSLGPIDNHTAMWLRDASLEGHLPTIEQLTYDPRIFPYYFGHALWAYIGEKWVDEVVGEILEGSPGGGVEGAFKRALGLSLDDLSSEWRDAVQTTYLPQLAEHYRARRIAQPVLTRKRSDGTLHIAPALSPDGRDIAYFSERKSFFVDLYLADAETGRVKRRLTKATLSNNYESLRFINSAGSFSPDGRYFAIAAKHNDKDDLVILDVKKDEEVRRITVPLNGLITPAWSPDGRQLVFTGYDGGLSDLFIINADGTGLGRLTNDKYADLQPAWSPDGKTIAFATDRGPATDFSELKIGNMRLALYHLDSGVIEILGHMSDGKNINPEWAPDGASLAFVSDRTGINNIYLYDFTDGNVYQLTDLYTGAAGIMQLSPVLSWARQADRLAFIYYEDGDFNVYAVDNPRSLKRRPFPDGPTPPMVSLLAAGRRDTTRPGAGTAISLSDMLGNHTLLFSGAVNGRLSEAQVLGAYTNQTHRLNWLAGVSQDPLYFYAPTTIGAVPIGPTAADSAIVLTTRLERFVIRDAFAEAFYPFNRFNRIELGLHAVSISNSILELADYYDQAGFYITSSYNTVSGATIGYAQPSVALVHDNALFGYVGPFAGARSRFEIAPTVGSWHFTAGLGDYRRYIFAPPFTLPVPGLFFGRFGRDADLFPIFLGSTELIRGYTAGSFRNNE